jgi:hypothetical protein
MVVHATGESVSTTHPDGLHAVVLAGDPQELQRLKERLTAASVPHRTIIEPDPPFLGEVMAVGITPAARRLIKPYVRHLSLLE